MTTNDRSTMTDQPSPPEDIQPGPVPTGFGVVTVANGAGESMVLLRVSTPSGVAFYFLEPAVAVQVGNALRAQGKAGIPRGPQLVTPPSGLVLPGKLAT